MPRPLKQGLSYFPHDTDAWNDEKIEAMRILHGNDGYAFFFMLCERIFRADNAELDVSTVETPRILSGKLSVTEEKFNAMLTTALSQRLFDPERYNKDKVLTSKGIKERADVVFRKRDFDRKSYLENISTVETRKGNSQRKPCGNHTTETRSKVKEIESKVKESINTPKGVVLPEWISLESWNGFVEMRKKQRHSLTERGKDLILKSLQKFHDEGQDASAILDQSTAAGWQGVFPLKEGNNGRTQQGNRGNGTTGRPASNPQTGGGTSPFAGYGISTDDLGELDTGQVKVNCME